MKLSKLVIYGFKSFAEKTTINFPEHLNGIVGPNGSGKSNIIDAIRWVLGEQSNKVLRSSKIEEIIFAGSKYRKPLNYAKVDIHFLLEKENSNQTELVISKEATRKNEVKYFINNQRVQLKEIHKITLMHNFSKDSLNIIGQGTITQIINSDIASKQKIIDIATGVMKYKINYRDANQKIERTNQDLEKLELIKQEQEKSLARLVKQKEKALEFQKVKVVYDSKEEMYVNYSYALIQNKSKKYFEKLNQAKNKKANAEKLKTQNDILIQNTTKSIEESELDLNTLNTQIHQLEMSIGQLNSKIEMLEFEKQSILKMQELNQAQIRESEIRAKENQVKIEANNVQISQIKQQLLSEEFDPTLIKQKIQSIENQTSSVISKKQDISSQKIHATNEIRNLEQKLESRSYLPFAVRKILDNKQLNNHGILADLIKFDSKYEQAITTWGARSLLNIVTQNSQEAKQLIDYVSKNKFGRITVFPLNAYNSNQTNNVKLPTDAIDYLSAYVKTEEKYRQLIDFLFGNVILVENYTNGAKVFDQLNQKINVITLDGTVFAANKSISGGKTQNQLDIFIENQINQAKEKINALELEENATSAKIQTLSEEKNKLTSQQSRIETERIKLTSEVEILLRTIGLLEAQMDSQVKTNDDSHFRIEQIELEIEQITNDLVTRNSEIQKCQTTKMQVLAKIEKQKMILKSAQIDQTQLNQEYMDINLKIQKHEMKIEDVKNQIDQIEMKYESILIMNYKINNHNLNSEFISNLKREVYQLERDLNLIGHVNLDAINEYEKLKIEYDKLTKNIAEIALAKEKLEIDIKRLMKKIKTTFTENFTKINKEFTECFRELFGGGDAKLTKVEEENVSGIDIIVSPPGKKSQNMNLLSGGEKTLATFALLVAIIRAMKQDFIILDEVEAMLDESNVDKVGQMLTNLTDTQVIMITHRTTSMSYLDLIYGVTMEEGGVSKVLKLNIKETSKE